MRRDGVDLTLQIPIDGGLVAGPSDDLALAGGDVGILKTSASRA